MQTTIQSLGKCGVRSPLQRLGPHIQFKTDNDRVLFDHSLAETARTFSQGRQPVSFESAGPREQIFFEPSRVTAGIVTCGGLCPGLNDVIRGIVVELYYRYGVQTTYGFRYGYKGLIPRYGYIPMPLRPDKVANIHSVGGTILGTSRGPQNTAEMVDTLEEMNINLLFVIGGDGTLRGAMELCGEIERRGLRKSVIGVPKTIDNDIMFLDKTFGFETAFAEAVKTVECARIEAVGSPNGVGLVKLMGRDSGFIACFTALAGSAVNFVLIPEVPFQLDGAGGLLETLRYRLEKQKSAVIVVSEGAGQDLLASEPGGTDASGNRRFGDIGLFLKQHITAFCASRKIDVNLKYIDPSYTIRSVPASAHDNVYCSHLAQLSVHAAMAGKTGMLVGRWHGSFVHLPLELITKGRRKVSPQDDLWLAVLAATGQPASFC